MSDRENLRLVHASHPEAEVWPNKMGIIWTMSMREGATDRISYGMDENGQHLLFVDTTTSNLDTTRRSPTAEEVVRFAEVAAESLPDSPYTTNLIGHAQARINELQG